MLVQGEGTGVLDEKIRWVLRNARQHAADPDLRTAAGFAGGGGRAPAVHRAQVGRWENGGAEVTHDLVRRYEVVLGLPEGQLLRAIDYFSRQVQPLRTMPTLVPRQAPDVDATLALLERALSTDRMSGIDWDHLSGNLSRMPHALVRDADWEELMRRCLVEMTVTTGIEFAHRDEAVARLAGHPRSAGVVHGMASRMLEDPTTAVYSDIATLLAYSSHRDVVPLLLRHAAQPVNTDALRAALFVLTMIIPSGRLRPAEAMTAARLALEAIRDGHQPFHIHRAAANLLRALDLPHRRRLASVLTADDRVHVARILMEGRALGLDAIGALKGRLLEAMVTALGPVDTREAVLQELLDTMLGTTEELARSTALGVLMLSPQSKPVGIAYAAELARARRAGDDVVAVECLSVLTWLVQPEDVDQLTAMVLDPSTPAEQAMLCAIAVGNCTEPASAARDAREEAVARRASELLTSETAPEKGDGLRQVVRGLTYILGMRGRFDLLAAVRDTADPIGPDAAVSAGLLDWWLGLPPHVRPGS